MSKLQECSVKVDGRRFNIYRTTNSISGNPRYIVHYKDLGLSDNIDNRRLRSLGLRKYLGKPFGGGYIFSSYAVENTLEFFIARIKEFKEDI